MLSCLVVDHDRIAQKVLAAKLVKLGHLVNRVGSTGEALEMLRTQPAEVVFLAVANGLEGALQIRDCLGPTDWIVGVTLDEPALVSPMNEWLAKPTALLDLCLVLDKHRDSRAA